MAMKIMDFLDKYLGGESEINYDTYYTTLSQAALLFFLWYLLFLI